MCGLITKMKKGDLFETPFILTTATNKAFIVTYILDIEGDVVNETPEGFTSPKTRKPFVEEEKPEPDTGDDDKDKLTVPKEDKPGEELILDQQHQNLACH